MAKRPAADLDGPHWRYAVGVYGRPGVSKACLALQDGFGVDVNVLLLALFGGIKSGARIGRDRIAELDNATRDIRDRVVRPLRAVRRHMKEADYGSGLEATRHKVKAAELSAEQLQQALLASVVADWAPEPPANTAEEIVGTVIAHYAGNAWGAEDAIGIIADAARAEACRPD